MIDTEVPAVKALIAAKDWIVSGWIDLTNFISDVILHHPTPRAVGVAIGLVILVVGFIGLILTIVDLLRRKKTEPDNTKELTLRPFTAHGSGEMVIQLTKEEAQTLKLIEDANLERRNFIENISIDVVKIEEHKKGNKTFLRYKRLAKAVVKVVFRKPYGENFKSEHIAMTSKAMSKLGIALKESEAKKAAYNKYTFRIRHISIWLPRGWMVRTILSPDQATALTYRMFIWSFLVSWCLTEWYYERNIIDQQNEKLAELSVQEMPVKK